MAQAQNRERHIAAQAHHVRPTQRYEESSSRNVDNFLRGRGHTELPAISAYLSGMELKDFKHHLGVREKDTAHDEPLTACLNKAHASAKKAGLKPTFKRKAGHAQVDGVMAEDGELIVAKNLTVVAPLPGNAALSDNFGNAQADDTPVKKVNPKKAARQAALEKSGTARQGNKAQTANQKVNADAQRAEAMSKMAKRQPRVFAKS